MNYVIDINVRTECGFTYFGRFNKKEINGIDELIKIEKGVNINKIIKLNYNDIDYYKLKVTAKVTVITKDIAIDTHDEKFIKWFLDYSSDKYQEQNMYDEIIS